MPNKGYNHDFKLLLEGIQVPFQSIQVQCTPAGNEANINLRSNKEVFDLKPKTSCQVFYRDWIPVDGVYGWRLMFDGFLSGYFKTDDATQGRGLGIVFRDFRMDIRKAPAALAYRGMNELTNIHYYNTAGLFTNWVVRGVTPKPKEGKRDSNSIRNQVNKLKEDLATQISRGSVQSGIVSREEINSNIKTIKSKISSLESQIGTYSSTGHRIRTYGNSGLDDLGEAVAYIAGTAYGAGLKQQKDGDLIYTSRFGNSLKGDPTYAKGGLFLDAVIRGMWTEATGGTSVGVFQNKRTRADKRMIIPKNETGYNFWRRQVGGLQIGSVIMGNSRFSSLEAAMLRLAGLFSTRVYSCSTPSLIPLESDALEWVMDPQVKSTLVDANNLEFGPKFVLNETMLLPPLEFTAPPNCNILLPPMYDKVSWQYDVDGDITRGYFRQIDTLSAKGSGGSLSAKSVQVPNALFDIYTDKSDNKKECNVNNKRDEFNRKKPPLTLEERYKGVSVYHSSVEVLLAQNDASKAWLRSTLNKKSAKKVAEVESKLDSKAKAIKEKTSSDKTDFHPDNPFNDEIKSIKKRAEDKVNKKRADRKFRTFASKTQTAMNRHALIKFLNMKYIGRVVNVDMSFNPYIMSGFPSAVITDDEGFGGESGKTMIGMVQQVKHMIVISPDGSIASTSVVLSGARFEDEPTDIDRHGNPLYMKDTNPVKAKINEDTQEFANNYFINDPKTKLESDQCNQAYDLNERVGSEDYIYAKDLLTLTKNDSKRGESNTVYLDDEYSPNKIHKFYKQLLRNRSDHFMIGRAPDPDDPSKSIKFAYDSIHEGLVKFRKNNRELLNDYEKCIRFVHRDVCSADSFYQGILGLSVRRERLDANGDPVIDRKTGKKIIEYIVNSELKNFKPGIIEKEYFGVSTAKWESGGELIEKLKYESGNSKSGSMVGPGECSSIREHLPITAFIKERKDAVRKYATSVGQRTQGVGFENANKDKST